MVNIKRNLILREKHDISHSKRAGCKVCKLDTKECYNSTKYMREKMYIKFQDDLIEKLKRNLKIIAIWKSFIVF